MQPSHKKVVTSAREFVVASVLFKNAIGKKLGPVSYTHLDVYKRQAELRHTSGSSRPVLLKTELTAGHGGSSGRYHAWRDAAFELAWLMDRTSPPSE